MLNLISIHLLINLLNLKEYYDSERVCKLLGIKYEYIVWNFNYTSYNYTCKKTFTSPYILMKPQ